MLLINIKLLLKKLSLKQKHFVLFKYSNTLSLSAFLTRYLIQTKTLILLADGNNNSQKYLQRERRKFKLV